MNSNQQQRLRLALEAAANIVPVQFQLECRRYASAALLWRVFASGLVFGLLAILLLYVWVINVLGALLLALSLAVLFFHSPASVWVWPKALLQAVIQRQYSDRPLQVVATAAQISIKASQYPKDLRILVSSQLADLGVFESIEVANCERIELEGLVEALVQSIEQCALAILPVAANLPPQQVNSSLRVLP